ncbi:hypothetical protein U9771_22485 [Escherichia coli]|uniref:hypothetical protein n=1 Tax=Enterobacteriaceae TaxID=543 RepID=UPI000A50CA86|nr:MULTISPECIES: hypothetical protein [Enterobacteriaceae]HDQ5700669.1 hypothetical protein [Shigella flexneri]EFH7788069.1 hypothetical protein [Escherichia coli]EFU8294321.1 hypothetical protein [Escherichia coli]EGS2092576.1 hypothetical protein [Escherichia coli]EHC1951389.1 hypothetical protein [Escherichia coli]
MNGDLEKLVDELESFDSSIRHLPIAEQQHRLRKFSCHHINNDTFPLSYVAG